MGLVDQIVYQLGKKTLDNDVGPYFIIWTIIRITRLCTNLEIEHLKLPFIFLEHFYYNTLAEIYTNLKGQNLYGIINLQLHISINIDFINKCINVYNIDMMHN